MDKKVLVSVRGLESSALVLVVVVIFEGIMDVEFLFGFGRE